MKNSELAYNTFYNKSDQLYHIFSPYRVCPLGAHVDHQHGVVTGFAFDKGIDFLFSKTNNSKIEMCSLSFEGLVSFDMNQNIEVRQANWGDYLRGAVYALKKHGYHLQYGIKGVLCGSMPISGLSSSAAALVGYVMALDKMNNLELTPMEIIQTASEAEREYIGLKNGILDQACVTLCEQNSLLYLDTRSNEYELIPKRADMPSVMSI
jgi:galactokinase